MLLSGGFLLGIVMNPVPLALVQLGAWWHRARVAPALAGLLSTPLVAWALHAAVWIWHVPSAQVRVVRRAALKVGGAMAVAAVAGLTTGCPFQGQSGAAGASDKPIDLIGSDGGGQSRGLIDGLFEHKPDKPEAPPEPSARAARQPFIDLLRNAYKPAKQNYEEPTTEARAPRPPRPAPRTSRRSPRP